MISYFPTKIRGSLDCCGWRCPGDTRDCAPGQVRAGGGQISGWMTQWWGDIIVSITTSQHIKYVEGHPLNSILYTLHLRHFQSSSTWQVDDFQSFLFCNTDIAVSMIWHKYTYEFQIQGYWKNRFWNQYFQILRSHKNRDSGKILTFMIIWHRLQHLTLQSRNTSAQVTALPHTLYWQYDQKPAEHRHDERIERPRHPHYALPPAPQSGRCGGQAASSIIRRNTSFPPPAPLRRVPWRVLWILWRD